MTIINISKGLTKGCAAWLIFLCTWGIAPGAWAAYEVSDVTSIPFVAPMTTYAKCTEDITVSWTAPSMSGSDILNGYLYKWNNSASSLNATDTLYTNFSAAVDGTVGPDVKPPNVVKPKGDLTDLDSGNVLYLHIMTFYLAGGVVQTVSSDVVYGPFLIDNKTPEGTVRVVDANGNDITSTRNTNVKVKLASSPDTTKVYLNESSAILTSLQLTYNTDAEYPFADTTPGAKTIYAWFEDAVGNISAKPATYGVTLLASIDISPNSATLDLATGATQVFRVEGTDASYAWAIIDEAPETVGQIVASIAGSPANYITVTPLNKGTFKLRAVPTGGVDPLTSGTISVVQNYTLGDVTGEGNITSGDALMVLRYAVKLVTLTDNQKAAGNVTHKTSNDLINSADALKILRYVVKLIPSFD